MKIQWRNKAAVATEEAIKAFEARLSVVLPFDYREFLKNTNGGFPNKDMFDTPDGRGFALSRLFPLGGELPFELLNQNRGINFPADYLDIGLGQSGDHLGIGIASQNYGNIFGSDHEYDVEEYPESTIYFVANSFSEFIEGLHGDEGG